MASDYFNTNQALETVLRYGSDLEDEEREDSDVLELQCSVQKKVTKTHAEKKTAKAKANDIVGAKPGEHAVEAATAHKALTSQIGAKHAKHTVEASTASNHKGSTPQHPSQDQRREVCIALINKYPGQQDATGGYDSWLNFLTNKFKNELYHLTPKQEKAAKSGNEKKALKYKVKRELQRGIVHWQPPPQSGENQESHEIHKTWLKKESGRPEKDRGGIKRRMELTYAFRRRYLNEEKRHVLDIMREYPCLFEEEEICNEFARLMADDSILNCGINRLLQLTPKILDYAKEKSSNSLIKYYLQLLDGGEEDFEAKEVTGEEKSLVALLCLPLLLEKETKNVKKPQDFFVKVVATKEEAQEGLKKDSPPSLVIVGQPLKCDEMLITAEGEVLFEVCGGPLTAMKCLIAMYYTLNFCYPKACSNTYIFIQKHVLQILDSNHTPVKVTVFVNELSK